MTYEEIFNKVLPYFEAWYPPGSGKELHQLVNGGDCYVMAAIVYTIAKQHGLNPTIFTGPHHVYLVDNGVIYDARYTTGFGGLVINGRSDQIGFYQGDLEPEGLKGLDGYFYNTPHKAYFVYRLLLLLSYDIPEEFSQFKTTLGTKVFYEQIHRKKRYLFNHMRRWWKAQEPKFLSKLVDLI